MPQRRHYSAYAVSRRATRRGQDKADDEYYAGLAKKHEAEAAGSSAKEKQPSPIPTTDDNKK